MADTPKLMATLIASLMITSLLISFFVLNVYGYSVLGINTLNTGLNSYSDTKDFISNCSVTDYYTVGSWSCASTGLVLTGAGELKQQLTDKERMRGIYKNAYHLKPTGGNYNIWFYENWLGEKVRLEVRNDGFHVKYSNIVNFYNPDAAFIPYEGATNINDIIITTITDTITPMLSLEMNGQTYTMNNGGFPVFTNGDMKYPIGVSAESSITIVSITKNFIADTASAASALDSLNMLTAFIGNVLALIVWNIDPAIFPWELNLLFIKTQAIGIFLCLVSIIRGGS